MAQKKSNIMVLHALFHSCISGISNRPGNGIVEYLSPCSSCSHFLSMA